AYPASDQEGTSREVLQKSMRGRDPPPSASATRTGRCKPSGFFVRGEPGNPTGNPRLPRTRFDQRSPAMTHFRDLAARCVFEARHVSRGGRPFHVFATWVCVARIRATN